MNDTNSVIQTWLNVCLIVCNSNIWKLDDSFMYFLKFIFHKSDPYLKYFQLFIGTIHSTLNFCFSWYKESWLSSTHTYKVNMGWKVFADSWHSCVPFIQNAASLFLNNFGLVYDAISRISFFLHVWTGQALARNLHTGNESSTPTFKQSLEELLLWIPFSKYVDRELSISVSILFKPRTLLSQ